METTAITESKLEDMSLETLITKLTPKERRFAEEYVVDFDARQAAIRLGVDSNQAHRWSTIQGSSKFVQQYIKLLLDQQADQTKLMANRIIIELARIAFGDITNLVTWEQGEMKLKDTKELSRAITSTVQDVGVGYGGKIKIKTYDKMQALELLMKHLGMVNPKAAESADNALDGLISVIQASRVQSQTEMVIDGTKVETIQAPTQGFVDDDASGEN